MAQTITVDPVTRLEGHAKIVLDLDDNGNVAGGHLQVLEIRGFEKLVEKMELFKMPQIIARICGVCPAAHHLASVIAIENGLGIKAPEEAALLRELLYLGHILHSHTLSTFFLAGPDILMGIDAPPGTRNIFSLLQLDAELAKKVLRLRSIGQRTVEIVGGRGVHPVAAIPGGMAARPPREKMEQIAGWGKEALGILAEVLPRVREHLGALDELRQVAQLPPRSMGLSREGVVDFLAGDAIVVNGQGETERRFSAADYADHLIEHVMPASYMKSVRLRGPEEINYFVGPLARLNVNNFFCTPLANAALQEFHAKGRPRLSALDFIEARLVEMLYCAERMVELAVGRSGRDPAGECGTARGALRRDGGVAARHSHPRLYGGRRGADKGGQPHRRHPEQLRCHRFRHHRRGQAFHPHEERQPAHERHGVRPALLRSVSLLRDAHGRAHAPGGGDSP